MKRTMYQAARHTPKEEAGGSNPFKRARLSLDAIRVPGSVFYFAFSLAFSVDIYFVNPFHTCGEQFATAGFSLS